MTDLAALQRETPDIFRITEDKNFVYLACHMHSPTGGRLQLWKYIKHAAKNSWLPAVVIAFIGSAIGTFFGYLQPHATILKSTLLFFGLFAAATSLLFAANTLFKIFKKPIDNHNCVFGFSKTDPQTLKIMKFSAFREKVEAEYDMPESTVFSYEKSVMQPPNALIVVHMIDIRSGVSGVKRIAKVEHIYSLVHDDYEKPPEKQKPDVEKGNLHPNMSPQEAIEALAISLNVVLSYSRGGTAAKPKGFDDFIQVGDPDNPMD